MYYDKYYPFYAVYADPLMYRGEKVHEAEFQRMKSYFPQTARIIQEKTEEKCDELDYEGSRLYDEHPDKFMLYHLSQKIKEEIMDEILPDIEEAESQRMPERFLDEMIQVLLYQEILRRRCRRKRCRGWF